MVRLAQELVPQIQAHKGAIDGEISHVNSLSTDLFRENDMVLCRTSAPLVVLCMKLIQSGITAVVKGKDIAVDITHDNSSDRPRAQVDLFSREAYYLPSEFAEIKELVSPPLEELNDFGPVDAGEVPFNAPDGGAPAQDNKPVY